MQNHFLSLPLTFSAGRERVSWTELSQTKHGWIPLSFQSSFGNKPTRSSPLLGRLEASVKDLHWGTDCRSWVEWKGTDVWEPTRHRTRVKPHAYRSTYAFLYAFSLSFMQINIHTKIHLQNPGNSHITHSVILVLLEYIWSVFINITEDFLAPSFYFFFFWAKQSKEQILSNPIPSESCTETWHFPQRILLCQDSKSNSKQHDGRIKKKQVC